MRGGEGVAGWRPRTIAGRNNQKEGDGSYSRAQPPAQPQRGLTVSP